MVNWGWINGELEFFQKIQFPFPFQLPWYSAHGLLFFLIPIYVLVIVPLWIIKYPNYIDLAAVIVIFNRLKFFLMYFSQL